MKGLNASGFSLTWSISASPLHSKRRHTVYLPISRSNPLIQTPIHTNTTHKASMSDYNLSLGRLYGPAWINGDLWDPGFKCVWSAEMDQSTHHCPACKSVIKRRCYDRLHVAFCLHSVAMPNGHQHFYGRRFKVGSPGACFLHGWGANEENRTFLQAKRGQDYEFPVSIPHEQPGWEMELSSFGPWNSPVHIRMGLVDGEQCFVRVLSYLANDQTDQFSKIARVPTREWAAMKTYNQLTRPNKNKRNKNKHNKNKRNTTKRNKNKRNKK